MVAYTKPKQRKKEECKRPRGERDQIKVIDLRFERWQVVKFRNQKRRKHTRVVGLSELCWGKAMVAYTKPKQWQKVKSYEERELRLSILINNNS